MKRLASLCAPALLLAACVHAPELPPAEPPPTLPESWRTLVGPQGPLAADWWAGFGDPVLTDYVRLALAHNPDVATAVARVAEARAQEQIARSALRPTLDFAFSDSRGRTLDAFGNPYIATTISPMFQASYEVDLSGRGAAQVRAAEAGTLAAEIGSAAAELSVAATTASAYITLRALDERLRVLQDTAADREDAVALARRRAEVGYTSDLEWRQAQAEYEGIAQQVPVAQLAIEREEHALAVLTGQAPSEIDRGRAIDRLVAPTVPDDLPSALLRRRPDIAQAEATVAAADANLAVARAQFLPTVNLSGSAGAVVVSILEYNPIFIWSLGASVLAPIYDGGRLEGQFGTAAASRTQAIVAYQRTVLTALREVEDNLAIVARTREERVRVQAQQYVLGEALRHARNRYRLGYSSYLDQLDAERNALNADLTLVQTQADELNALVALNQAMGGGWTPAANEH